MRFPIIFLSIAWLLIGLTLMVRCSSISTQISSSKNERPNIVMILVDDLGKEWVSCYGADLIETPNVDALAQNGMKFDNMYVMPQCTPTRVSLLTGQYPFRHGWVNHWDVPRWGGGAHFDETQNPCLSLALKQSGYATCVAGKWQVDDFRVEPDAMTRAGFDHYCMWTGYETGIEESGERYHNPYVRSDEGAETLDGAFGPDVFTNFITEFIGNHADTPFFVYYPMVLTHTPLVVPPGKSAESNLKKHQAMVQYADDLTGKIVASLEAAGVLDNTLIIWTTDNGTTGKIQGKLNGRKIRGAKSKTTEPGACMPFIAHWPAQIKGGQTSDALVDVTDLLPTFLDLAGKPLKGTYESWKIDGQSFAPALKGKSDPEARKWILSMGGGNQAALTESGVQNKYRFRDRVIRNKQYKLYIDTTGEPQKFFNLKADPAESDNLIERIEELGLQEAFGELVAVVDQFPQTDADPQYLNNPSQTWDVQISQVPNTWKQ
ncbi:sulfatase-like hydrolase/transferase [Pontibacter sp. G13]|uniref:sulfatase-like hydrolase/transferase n=1 Tax=Pontibacter sp. G13 TaxID=3074898 RepID=UPI00288B2984|nr:sulfatase-like hydrolase/transferase [Pontibacter sp. G13]WNJ18389.1 sulfatase-like hydrolase/transferase [Pontibacter sp. G13]